MSTYKTMDEISSSAAAGKTDGAAKSKDAVPRRWTNIEMAQNVLLIWLDSNIDDNSTDYSNTITQLQTAMNTIKTFTDEDQCIDFLTDICSEKVCMIISTATYQSVVPIIHDVPQLHSIFIFGENKTGHEQWAKPWSKIKGLFTEMSLICEVLKQAAQQCEQNAISISFMATDDDISKKNLDQLDPSFMYTQILKEILLTINFEPKHIAEFIKQCCSVFADNQKTLEYVKKFERKYHDKTPIWWYTSECFLYSMINRCLRVMDVNIIINMGFFIGDLHRHIGQLHKEQFNGRNSDTSFTVYRGQGMSRANFEQMRKNKGGLISFNNFLSTSMDYDVSLFFAESNKSNPDLIGILFVMSVVPSQSSAPFASINNVGSYGDKEDEVLFAMHTVFRIYDIISMDEDQRLFRVELTLTSDNDKDLRVLTDRIREETFPNSAGWYRLSLVLLQMGQLDKAEEVCEILLKQVTEKREKGPIYHQLGCIKDTQGKYKGAITFYEKSLEIQKQSLPSNHPHLACSYDNISEVYRKMGEYSKALSYYEKALEIRQQPHPSNHPDFTMSYSNIGMLNFNMGEYSKALSSHENVLAIQQQSLPPNHPDLAMSHNNIGVVYDSMGEYLKALSSYKKALAIRQQSLPPNHPHFAMSYNNIGSVYLNLGEYSKALSYYEKALEIQKQLLPTSHPYLAMTHHNIGLAYDRMSEYSKALSSYRKALEIKQQSLPPTHPHLASSYSDIGEAYRKMGEYSKALSHHEKALGIRQKSLPPNHSDLAISYSNIGLVNYSIGEYSRALSSHEKALEIQKQSLSPNHPHLAVSYINIGLVYDSMGNYSKALSSHEKALEIRQQSLPPNHPDLAISYNNIGLVYDNMGDYPKALSYYEKALAIGKQSLPPNHPDLAMSYNNLGALYQDMGEYSKALSYHEKALAIRQQSLPSNHSDLAMSYNNIGFIYYNMGDYSKALLFYERAVGIGQQSLPSNHRHLQTYKRNLDNVKKKL